MPKPDGFGTHSGADRDADGCPPGPCLRAPVTPLLFFEWGHSRVFANHWSPRGSVSKIDRFTRRLCSLDYYPQRGALPTYLAAIQRRLADARKSSLALVTMRRVLRSSNMSAVAEGICDPRTIRCSSREKRDRAGGLQLTTVGPTVHSARILENV